MWQWQCGEGNAARAVDRAARAAAARAGRLLLGRRRCQIAAAFTATMAAKGCAAVCRGRLGSNLYVRPVMKPATNERTRMYERCRGRPKAPPGPQRARETPPSAGQSHADDYYASGASMAAVCSSAAEITPVCCSSTCCASLPKVPRCLQCGRVIFAVAPPDHLPSVPTGSSPFLFFRPASESSLRSRCSPNCMSARWLHRSKNCRGVPTTGARRAPA